MNKTSFQDGSKAEKLIKISYGFGIILTTFFWVLNFENPLGFAIISMAVGLFILWGICSAFIMYRSKYLVKSFFQSRNLSTFVIVTVGGILLALIEEAFATLMTNTAPLFGFTTKEAFITYSGDYIEVVTQHSVIVFIPWFIAWGIILSKYDIHPNTVMVLFGITGIFAESLSFGLQNIFQFGFWIVIYGLMIYLPAFIVFEPGSRKTLRLRYYPLLIIIPFFMLVLWSIFVILLLLSLGLSIS